MRGLAGLARRSLAARRLRSFLTIVGIGLGVAVLTSALIINAALDGAADHAVRDMLGSAALRVSAVGEAGLSDASLQAIGGTPGVTVVAPVLERRTYPVSGGAAEAGTPGLPSPITVLGVDPAADAALHERPLAAGQGLPATGDVIVVSDALARQDGLAVGGTLTLLGSPDALPRPFTVVGILAAGAPRADPLDRTALVPLAIAEALFDAPGVTRAEVGLAPGASIAEVGGELERRLAVEPYTLTDAGQLAASLRDATRDFRSSMALVAAIALFGGAFMIFNTLAMTVAERARDLGLLRAAGMTRRQVVRFVLLIALQLGVVGVVLGTAAGVGLAALLIAYLDPAGIAAIGRDLVIHPVELALAAGLGLGVTLAAALEPALRAGRISPVEALAARLDQASLLRTRMRWILAVFVVIGLAGTTLWPGALSAPGGLLTPLAVYGLLLLTTIVSPFLVEPMGLLASLVARTFLPVETRLTRGSIVRDRSRTALTVGALAIALAVFVGLGGVASSTRRASTAWLEEVLPGEMLVTSVRPVALDEPAPLDLAAIPGVERFSPYARFSIASDGRRLDAAAVVGADLLGDGRLSLVAGERTAALTALDAGGSVILPQATAERLSIPLGGTLRVLSGRRVVPLAVVGIAARTIPGEAGESVLFGWREALGQLGVAGADGFVVRFAPGAGAPVRQQLEGMARTVALEPVPLDAVAGSLGASVDRIFLLFGALALVALVVAALGIVNTLMMNVLERSREIAILRATGLTRGQAWRMVMLEAGILGLVGSVLGVLAGLGSGVLMVAVGGSVGGTATVGSAAVDAGGVAAGIAGGITGAGGSLAGGLGAFAPAWGTVVVALVAGVVLALAAAAYPARLASRLEIVRTIQHD